MEATIKIINRMLKDGVVEHYAVGGAMGAIFYIEPFTTYDLDVFFDFKSPHHALNILEPLFVYLNRLGYQPEGEAINIEGLPVQFLPVFNPLIGEGVNRAQELMLNETPVNVMRPEHLIAIMLDTGRAKDYARVDQFLRASAVDLDALHDVLLRHGLIEKWVEFERRYFQ